MTKLFLDAGHGGNDSGAVGNGLYEKNIVLSIVKYMEEYLKAYKDVEVKLSRNTDDFISLSERTNLANNWGADAFISVHINSATDKTARGFETYVHPQTGAGTVSLQNVVHEEITKQISSFSGFRDRGKKRANFHVLRETNMKALLTENLFISNSADANILKSPENLKSLALGHVFGLEKFYGLERIRPPSDDKGEILYQVVAGTFSEIENARKKVQDLKKDGHESFIRVK